MFGRIVEQPSWWHGVRMTVSEPARLGTINAAALVPRDRDGLFVQRGEYLLDQPLRHPRRLRPQQRDQPPTARLAYLGR